ncbi:hypothetical protein PspLS_03276 [Pyricularia sp. CBS 133598]|nr:hypothetical protein PspLS_03276 [Pyricularia sp. CBS 133598]
MVSFIKFTLLLATATSAAASGHQKFAVSFTNTKNNLLDTGSENPEIAQQWEKAFDKKRSTLAWSIAGFDGWEKGLLADWGWVTTTRKDASYSQAKTVLEGMGFEADIMPSGYVWFRPKPGALPPGLA